jgi:hypothetical protein
MFPPCIQGCDSFICVGVRRRPHTGLYMNHISDCVVFALIVTDFRKDRPRDDLGTSQVYRDCLEPPSEGLHYILPLSSDKGGHMQQRAFILISNLHTSSSKPRK